MATATRTDRATSIPPMTDPLGRYWKQPDHSEVLVDEEHALMGQGAFDKLRNYSHSIPTGVYAGKMWRTKSGDKWYLRWYSPSDKPEYFDLRTREIIIVEPDPAYLALREERLKEALLILGRTKSGLPFEEAYRLAQAQVDNEMPL